MEALCACPSGVSSRLLSAVGGRRGLVGCLSVPVRRTGTSVLGGVGHGKDGTSLSTLVGGVETGVPRVALEAALVANFPSRARRRFARLYRFMGRAHFSHLNYFTCSPRRSAITTRVRSRVSRRAGISHTRGVVRVRVNVTLGGGRRGVNDVARIVVRN